MTFNIDENGYYGPFGGAHIPEMLRRNIETLQSTYLKEINTESFRQEFDLLLKDYVGRPSPLYFSENLSEKYGIRLYLKREDLNHTGAHKINNAIGQVLLARRMGKKRIIAETGAGQHGVATATVCALMDMECSIYMGATDIARQMLNVQKMEMLGAQVVSVESGNKTLKEAVDEALAEWCAHPDDTFYLIGSAVGPHPYPDMVARFQSVISAEIKKQLAEKEGRDYPDYLIACVGGGSNAIGTFYHYLDDKRVKLIEAEAAGLGLDTGQHAATMSLGSETVLHGSKTLVLTDSKGEVTEPYSISAGLDYPGVGPAHANLSVSGRAEIMAVTDDQALDAAFELTRAEGIIPALESSHALAVLSLRKFEKDAVVVLTVSGRGDKDMPAYLKAFNDRMKTK